MLHSVGVSVCAGIPFGGNLDSADTETVDRLWSKMWESNRCLMSSLVENEFGEELLQSMKKDSAAGRMSEILAVQSADELDFLLAPRFGVAQQKADGSRKIRPIDNYSWSMAPGNKKVKKMHSVNGSTFTEQVVRHDSLTELGKAMRKLEECIDGAPALFKADIDSAYRRLPIKPNERWASGVAIKHGGQVRPSMYIVSNNRVLCSQGIRCIPHRCPIWGRIKRVWLGNGRGFHSSGGEASVANTRASVG